MSSGFVAAFFFFFFVPALVGVVEPPFLGLLVDDLRGVDGRPSDPGVSEARVPFLGDLDMFVRDEEGLGDSGAVALVRLDDGTGDFFTEFFRFDFGVSFCAADSEGGNANGTSREDGAFGAFFFR